MSEPGEGVCRARRRGRRNKVRATAFPTRLYHQKRSAENAASTGGPEEPQPARAAQYRQLRREGLMTKVKPEKKTVKSEKNNTTTCSPTAHSCEQWNLHKQKNKCNAQHTKTNSPRKLERIQTDSELSNSAVGNTKKPLTSAENIQKTKKGIFTIDVKEINYAGAKFSDPPSPSVLPKPPSHWMDMTIQHSDQCKELMTYHLKALLKAQL